MHFISSAHMKCLNNRLFSPYVLVVYISFSVNNLLNPRKDTTIYAGDRAVKTAKTAFLRFTSYHVIINFAILLQRKQMYSFLPVV